ncbi:TetR/AcrR family transcriptional regulator [Paracoccus spongiarum]|uniref:TetR/AcrR family transcriptional regulator n=1 Tax=Paracoccus spongiarum TaxID=3064387 RepID=A0ABT9JCD3_9RHOB|nr:TetR/AcrR family transcriptional regulator [Paracoccus sp. 2205BS29-5]MDP5307476.1 TetR/AcrR family transcriptional regulator [Paracoccus sp. 2205BS29-5]
MPRPYKLTEDGRAARAARSTETREALMAAAHALFGQHGYDGVSVTEIARKAGVSASLINTYFEGKAGLAYALVESLNDAQEAASRAIVEGGGPPLRRLRDMLLVWARGDLSDPRILQVVQGYSWQWSDETETRNRATRAIFKGLVADLVAEAQHSGEIAATLAPARLADAIFGLYTWRTRDAVFSRRAPEEALDLLWPQIESLLQAARPA